MKGSTFVQWVLFFAHASNAVPGLPRRQNAGSAALCTCPTNGPVTTTIVPVTTITTTLTTQGGTVTSTAPTATRTSTSAFTSTITVTTGTTTIVFPGVTVTTTATSIALNTTTVTTTLTACTTQATRKVKRQDTSLGATTTTTVNSPPSVITTVFNVNSTPATCTCVHVPTTTNVFSTSSICSCPATSGTITVTASSTSTVFVTQTTAASTTIVVTPQATSTSTVTSTVTVSALATTTSTQSSLTITSQAIQTNVVTVTATTVTCKSTSSTSSSAAPSATVPLVCNSTAYLIGSLNNVPTLYNIDLSTSYYFVVNGQVGNGAYAAINAMGYNVLDNYLYAIAQPAVNTNVVLRISATGVTQEIAQFQQADPPTAGDVDVNGQYWMVAGGGTQWRHIDLRPGSSTYGQTIANGTTTVPGYNIYDMVYLPGNSGYMFSLAQSSAANATLGLLRFSQTTQVWTVDQNDTVPAPYMVIANWPARNNTLWGLVSTNGNVYRQTLGMQPTFIGTAPGTLNYADGARCALSVD